MALVTGRGIDWLLKGSTEEGSLLDELEAMVGDKAHLDNLYMSGEFGGSYLLHQNGQRGEVVVREEVVLPDEVRVQAAKMVLPGYEKTMIIDTQKRVIFTAQINPEGGHEQLVARFGQFQREQPVLKVQFEELLEAEGLTGRFEVHTDQFAINIRSKESTKGQASAEVLEWLKAKGVHARHFKVFGDSVSDAEMAEEVSRQVGGERVEFVFVGDPAAIERLKQAEPGLSIVCPAGQYAEGTAEYLQKLELLQ